MTITKLTFSKTRKTTVQINANDNLDWKKWNTCEQF